MTRTLQDVRDDVKSRITFSMDGPMTNESDQIRATFACSHDDARLVKRTVSNGVTHYGYQCQRCGHWTRSVRKATLSEQELLIVPLFDDELKEQWNADKASAWAAWRDRRRRLETTEWRAKRARYSAYLKTEQWRDKSRRVVERDGTCRACEKRPATQAHHLNYNHIYNEPLFDLVGVCELCHGEISRMDKARRERAF